MEYLGNRDILKEHKTAYLCSQRCPAMAILKSYDWAKEQRKAGRCVVCGNHSRIEKDVFEILLRGTQPIILVLARGMKSRWEPEILEAVEQGRLLVIAPFPPTVTRVTRDTAKTRNRKIIELSDRIVAGYVNPGGSLEEVLAGADPLKITFLI